MTCAWLSAEQNSHSHTDTRPLTKHAQHLGHHAPCHGDVLDGRDDAVGIQLGWEGQTSWDSRSNKFLRFCVSGTFARTSCGSPGRAVPPAYATIHARAQRCDDRVPRGLHAAVFVSISHRQCVSLKRPTASSARLQPLLVCSLCLRKGWCLRTKETIGASRRCGRSTTCR